MRLSLFAYALGALFLAGGMSGKALAQGHETIVASADVETDEAQTGPRYFDNFELEDVGEYDLDAPDLDYVWVDGDEIPDGTPTEGFYRVRSRPGLTWVDARFQSGIWKPGGWRPSEIPKGMIWVDGHRGNDGYWVSGNWRPEVLPGYIWQPPSREANVRISGSWEPLDVLPDTNQSTWVAGYWDSSGAHLEGFWRSVSRPGYTWKLGHWRYGKWRAGHWQPNKARHKEIWSAGFWNGKAWQSGQWRATEKKGFSWAEAYRGFHGRWIKSQWKKIRRKTPRRHRVFRVDDLAKVRNSHRTVWHKNKSEQHDQRAHDRAHNHLQRRVERVQHHTETDRRHSIISNKRMERRRVLMQRKHRRIENRRRRKARRKKAVKKR